MILSQRHKRFAPGSSERWLGVALAGVLLLGVAYVLLQYSYRPAGLSPGEAIECDAERVSGSHFVDGGYEFEKGDLQNREQARSGWFSCRVPPGEGAQYGFGYRLRTGMPGEVYRATVWRYKNRLGEGKLAVNGSGAAGFYHETDEVRSLENGWEQLSVTFHIPYQSRLDYINIYVYTNGYEPIFFDDLRVERIDFWAESVFEPTVLQLEIGNGGQRELARKREEAIREGILFSDGGDWVRARIAQESEKLPVRLRLKGDWLDHLAGDKWSYRVKVGDPHNWRGLREFSLHTPAARYFLHEWLLHRFWEQEDVLTTRYDFVELQIDGDSKGIYAYEEHFVKQLVESRRRREGPILKFNEEGLWLAYQRQLEANGFIQFGHTPAAAAWENALIAAFDQDDLERDTLLGPVLARAAGLLAGYLEGRLSAGSVFDLDRMAAFYAGCDLLNGYHGIVWHNLRFYFNPVTSLLEPIGFDGFGGPPENRPTILGEGALNPQSILSDNLFRQLAQDSSFARRYVQRLYRYSAPAFFEPFLDSVREEWTARKTWLQMEFPGYDPKLRDFRERARFVHALILPYSDQSIQVVRTDGAGSPVLLRNTHTLPLEVIGWGTGSNKPTATLEPALLLPGQTPRVYLSRLRTDSLAADFASWRFLEEAALQEQAAAAVQTIELPPGARYVYYRPLGLDTLFFSSIHRASPSVPPMEANAFKGSTLEPRPFFSVEGRRLTFLPGVHQLREHLYIPAGYDVEIPAGTTLDLVNGAAFFSRSAVQATGEAEAPVRILSSDGTGNGFTVMGAGSTSVLKNVDFNGLNTLSSGIWQLTGAVNFHESPVRIYRCRFAANHCEDALNIIRSDFQLESSIFQDIYSDGFDSDFSKGEIRNCTFRNTANDGLDVSGSIVNVFECQFDTNGDKGISVGEASDLTVFNSSFRNAPIALASKDQSMLYARNVTIEDCEQGFAAYQKKPEFGGATILVESYRATNVRRLYMVGQGSKVQIDR